MNPLVSTSNQLSEEEIARARKYQREFDSLIIAVADWWRRVCECLSEDNRPRLPLSRLPHSLADVVQKHCGEKAA